MKLYKKLTGRNMKYIYMIAIVAAGLFLAGCAKKSEAPEAKKQKEYYTCPMHPQIISDKPGVCPICQMDLVKKSGDEQQVNAKEQDNMNAMVAISGTKRALANVSTIAIKKVSLQKDIISYGYLDFAEQNRKSISARFNGRIEKLYITKTGDVIRKGAPLFEIYSPELVQAQNDFLIALNANSNIIQSARKKLELFGLTSTQIQELEKSRDVKTTITYYSPIGGTVIEKKIREGMYVNEGTLLFDIADFSTLWNISEVYESDIAAIHTGNPVKIRLRAYPGKEFDGKVTFISPVVDAQSRTIKVRSEISNSSGLLKPQMYGETVHHVSLGVGLFIPADAVINTGKRMVAWVKTSDGMFEARDITLGDKCGNGFKVISGLQEGDEVAVTGGFLIDSESQLKTAHSH
jgi:membrane fusion protein, copper/silver efflux system